MKLKKIFCITALTMLSIYILLICFYYLHFDSIALSRVRVWNHKAAIIWYEVSEHLDALNIPQNADIILTGEIKNDDYEVDYMLVYSGALSDQSFLLIGDDTHGAAPSAYWAARISEGTVTETWYSKKLIPEEAIHSYSELEQPEQVEFVTLFTSPRKFLQQQWYYDLDLIGYYKFKSDG